jgi:UDP-3-O-[3-hydroxymyristoyl] glucosamine N-acyltransferase
MAGSVVGDKCTVAPEAVIGSRGFGYIFDGRQHVRIPQVGRVEIGDNTEIGPATCLDRAALDVTSVGKDCKLGALIQVAHNCRIGDDSQIGSGSGLAGSTKIGRGARFGRRVGTAGHSNYGDNVRADDLAGMTKTKIPGGTHWAGHPARQVKS